MHALRLPGLPALRRGHGAWRSGHQPVPARRPRGCGALGGPDRSTCHPLNPDNGLEGPRTIAIIDEAWCIGCTLCIGVCPTDAIVGANKRMHTVIEPYCTGCELCIPACPVDCISLEPVDLDLSGWAAWPQNLADLARTRYDARQIRLQREAAEHDQRLQAKALKKLAELPAHTKGTEHAPEVDRKRAIIEAALAKAKARHATKA